MLATEDCCGALVGGGAAPSIAGWLNASFEEPDATKLSACSIDSL